MRVPGLCCGLRGGTVDVADPISTQESRIDWKAATGIGACLIAVELEVLAALDGVMRRGATYDMKMLMNEYRLNLGTSEAQEFLLKQMDEYFFGEGAALPPDFVPPRAKQ